MESLSRTLESESHSSGPPHRAHTNQSARVRLGPVLAQPSLPIQQQQQQQEEEEEEEEEGADRGVGVGSGRQLQLQGQQRSAAQARA